MKTLSILFRTPLDRRKMTKEKLAELSDEELFEKYKSAKSMTAIFVLLVACLLYFEIAEYRKGGGVTPMSVITICTIGGLVSLLPDLKKMKNEIANRG